MTRWLSTFINLYGGKFGLDCCSCWWKHAALPELENKGVNVLWDFNIIADHLFLLEDQT